MARIRLSEKFKKAPKFLTIEPYLRPQDTPIASHPEARAPRIVPPVVFDYGCTLCIKYCPFSYAEYGKLKSKFEIAP